VSQYAQGTLARLIEVAVGEIGYIETPDNFKADAKAL